MPLRLEYECTPLFFIVSLLNLCRLANRKVRNDSQLADNKREGLDRITFVFLSKNLFEVLVLLGLHSLFDLY
jgi:hypothetical protein